MHTAHCHLDAHVISAVSPVGRYYPSFIEEMEFQAQGDGGTCCDSRKGPEAAASHRTGHREGPSQAVPLPPFAC